MARREDYQFDYPERGWSTGKMRTARMPITNRSGVSGSEIRELESVRKERTQHLSEGAGGQQYAQMNRSIVSDADVGTGAGAIKGPGSQAIGTIEKLLQSQKNAQGQFDTVLSPAEETEFRKWKQKHAPNDSGEDYDLRGAFKSGFKPDDKGHLPDLYKKPNHPTFSDQSIYARDAPDKAGRWEGDTFIPPGGG